MAQTNKNPLLEHSTVIAAFTAQHWHCKSLDCFFSGQKILRNHFRLFVRLCGAGVVTHDRRIGSGCLATNEETVCRYVAVKEIFLRKNGKFRHV
jgi:hypothetical protein